MAPAPSVESHGCPRSSDLAAPSDIPEDGKDTGLLPVGNFLLVGLHRTGVSCLGHCGSGSLHSHVLQDMHATRGCGQLDGSLFVVDRRDMARVHHHQASPGRFESDPVHLVPREIM